MLTSLWSLPDNLNWHQFTVVIASLSFSPRYNRSHAHCRKERQQFVRYTAVGVLALFFLPSWQAQSSAQDLYSQRNRGQALSRDVPFQQPAEIHPGAAETSVELMVRECVSLIDGTPLQHMAYNAGPVGPTIRISQGQHLKIKLINQLGFWDEEHNDRNEPHGFNVTNLHTHGLHVSPQSPADDVFKEVRPGEICNYDFPVANDHPAGTFWYHAHKHGSTALQLANGMAGALIVEGGLDEIPEIRAAAEKVMVIQQFTWKEVAGRPAIVDPELVYDESGELFTTINGVLTPTLVLRPGEIQRWRIVHAGIAEQEEIDIPGIEIFEIAVDGLATGSLTKKDSLLLYPGYRTDVLVRAPADSLVTLVESRIDDREKAIRQRLAAPRFLMKVVVQGAPLEMELPGTAVIAEHASFTQQDVPEEIDCRRTIRFSMTSTDFFINGEPFDPNKIDHKIQLDSTEEWELSSENGVHPFHIHVNPFASRLKGSNDPWVWRDTIAVQRGRPVIARMRFKSFTGKTVFHCHNLVHEDKGMMRAIEIMDAHLPDSTKAILEEAVIGMQWPSWGEVDSVGQSLSSEDFAGRPTLLVFHRGIDCVHCAEQLRILDEHAERFRRAGISLVAISPYIPAGESNNDSTLSSFRFPLMVDEDLNTFRAFGCVGGDGSPLHGLIFKNHDDEVTILERSEVAETDVASLTDRFLNQVRK